MEIKVINNVDLNDLDLSVRAWNCLRRAMINNVQDIVDNIDNLPRIKNLGQKCYDEVLEKIKPYIEEVDKICITNYDRIKSMSVEEMAELFVTLHYAMECRHYNLDAREVYKNLTKEEKEKTDIWEEESKPHWKQWLLQEVRDDE